MRNPATGIVCLLLTLGLTGCFTSEQSLITDKAAVAPYEQISFQAEDDSQVTTGLREGNAYILQGQDTDIALRFMDIGKGAYIVEVTGVEGTNIVRLFGALQIDFDAGTASAYKVFGSAGDLGPGLRSCSDDTICIDDLDAYVALARAEIESGAEPDAVYAITVE